MKTFLFGFLSSALLLTRVFAQVPPGEWRQSLEGVWQFAQSPEPASSTVAISVPGNWDTLPAFSTYVGKGWYHRSFDVPADWRGKHVRLCFGAVCDTASVVLNGKDLGSHTGGYTPFEFDVSGHLEYGGPNTITVCADNTRRRGAWWHWGGISGPVGLVANNDLSIVRQHVRAEPDLRDGTAEVFVRCTLANSGDRPQTVRLAAALDRADAPGLSSQAEVPAHGETVVESHLVLPRENVRLWDFDHPNLYHLTTRLSSAGDVAHEMTSQFGIRKVEVTPDGLYLNGERIHVCGFNRVSDSLETGDTEPDKLVRGDIDLMKSAGANLERIMHFAQSPGLLDYLDEKGMLIFEEIPVWGGGDPNMKTDNPLTQQWMREMIERDYNHPCIIGWSVGNELQGHYAYGKSMIAYTRSLDPHRLATVVSNTGVAPNYGPDNDPISFSDILLHNYYGEDTARAAETLRKKWPALPIFFSEFGSSQFGTSPEAKIPGLQKRWDGLAGHPYVIGASVWTFNDYRDGWAHAAAAANPPLRTWGVVDVERRPKAAYEQVRKLFCPVRALTVQGGSVSVEPRKPDEIPSYPLRGYQVCWTARGSADEVLQAGTIALPELKPGDPAWTGKFVPSPPAAARIAVKLVTPTGYDVADAVSP